MSKLPGIVYFVEGLPGSQARSRNYDPSRKYPQPLTDDDVRARIEFLKAENAQMRRIAERRAQASADHLMREMQKNRG